MKGVIAADLILVLALIGCLYVLWLHDEQIKQLEFVYDRLGSEVAGLKPKPRARAPKDPMNRGKVDE